MNSITYWDLLEKNFKNIIYNNSYLYIKYKFLINNDKNILLYCVYGFPLDILIDQALKEKYNINFINKTECVWEKNVIYYENKFFIELDLMNPSIPKDYSFLTKFILHILKNKNIINKKHLIIIKHINLLKDYYSVFKILLESFSNNAYFICTTYFISTIEQAIASRFTSIRIPLFKNNEIIDIFSNYFYKPLNINLINNNNRNLILAIFIASVEDKEPHLITYDFCNFNYPPLYDFIKNFKKNSYNINNIRNISYNCFQYNIKISQIIDDILKIIPSKNKANIIKIAADLEHKLILTNKGREPIYIECLLSQLLL